MAQHLYLERVYVIGHAGDNVGTAGPNILTNGDIIYQAEMHGSAGQQQNFYGSSDDGATWELRSSLNKHQIVCTSMRNANLPDNVLLAAAAVTSGGGLDLFRSADGARSWTKTAHLSGPTEFAHGMFVSTIQSYGRKKAIALGGVADNIDTGFTSNVARTLDAGASWAVDSGNAFGSTARQTIGAGKAAGGRVIAAKAESGFFLSTDAGLTWTAAPAMNAPGWATTTYTMVCCYLTPQILLGGGAFTGTGGYADPALWRSTDRGASWTRIAAANVEGYGASSGFRVIRSLHRLTKNGAVLGLDQPTGLNTAPVYYSIDAGATWKQPDTAGRDWHGATLPQCSGAIVITKKGTIILGITVGGFGGDSEIWRGHWEC